MTIEFPEIAIGMIERKLVSEFMKISIVTTVLNRDKKIADAIDCVANQTYPFIEHVIQDGGSSDRTIDVIRNLDVQNLTFKSEPDQGIYDGLNRAIKRSTGDIIGLLHSDDRFATHDTVQNVVDAFKTSDADAVYGDLVYVSKFDPVRLVRYWRAGNYAPQKLKFGWMPPHPALFVKRSVFENFGYYNENYKIAADYDAILRWFLIGKVKVHYLPEVLVHMNVGGESNRSLLNIARKSYEDYLVIKRHAIGGVGTLVLKNLRKANQFFGNKKIQNGLQDVKHPSFPLNR